MTVPAGTRRRTLFWKVAPALVGLQLVIVAISAGLTVFYARDAQETLASTSLSARLDATAEEIERRSGGLENGWASMDESLLLDLHYRFPDPLFLIDLNGEVFGPIWPAEDAFGLASELDSTWTVPDFLQLEEAFDGLVLDLGDTEVDGGFASAPLYDRGGFPVALLVVQPLRRSLEWELAESRTAFREASQLVAAVSVALALLFGAFLTWWLVRPVRSMASVVADIDGENPDLRIPVRGADEMAVLGSAINQMADRVAASIRSLRETDRLRREMVANVGHDLRTPLAGIRLRLEEGVRLSSEGRLDEARASLDAAQRQVDHVTRLIEDLFELSRLEGDASLLHMEPVLPAEWIGEAVGMYRSAAREAGVALEVDLPKGLPLLQADGTRLIRLLGNLLSNAVRHTPSGGSVRIAATVMDGSLVVTVRDTGEGLSPDMRERLFDRYYRGNDARTRGSHQRTGLGLAIARAIAEAHGGTLDVAPTEGSGTTLRLQLPLA
jgi:signal transduction histidine kinase